MQFEMAVSLNHDVMTSFCLHMLPRTPKSESCRVVDNCVRLLQYAYGQLITMLKCLQICLTWQFKVAVSLNHDVMTTFQLHK